METAAMHLADTGMASGTSTSIRGSPSMTFSNEQVFIQRVLAITASSVSLLFGLVSFHWFLRMRKTFRHHLIMLIIASGMAKALWLLIYPAVSIARGAVVDDSDLCQVSGYLFAVGLEAADFAILMMALHSGLCIFKPNTSHGDLGLYRHRNIMYTLWIVIPNLMAALAFVDPQQAYVSQGTYCWLPVRPFWYRLALSWIPRYLILITIACTYLAIYVFVRRTFKRFDFDNEPCERPSNAGASSFRRGSREYPLDGATEDLNRLRRELPAEPELQTHGLIPSAVSSSASIGSMPFGVLSSWLEEPARPSSTIRALPDESEPSSDSVCGAARALEGSESLTEGVNHTRSFPLDGTFGMEGTEPPLRSQSRLSGDDGNDIALQSLRTRHTAIKRQLRLLFIYPLVYMLMWVLPFINHCASYNNHYSTHPNFIISVLGTTAIAIHGAVDSMLFSWREKPWQNLNDSNESVWTSLTFWRKETNDSRNKNPFARLSGNFSVPHQGQSRGRMLAEAHAARERRAREDLDARENREDTQRRRKMSLARRSGRGKDWFDRKDSVIDPDLDGQGSTDCRVHVTQVGVFPRESPHNDLAGPAESSSAHEAGDRSRMIKEVMGDLGADSSDQLLIPRIGYGSSTNDGSTAGKGLSR